jgi:hypothetical protein
MKKIIKFFGGIVLAVIFAVFLCLGLSFWKENNYQANVKTITTLIINDGQENDEGLAISADEIKIKTQSSSIKAENTSSLPAKAEDKPDANNVQMRLELAYYTAATRAKDAKIRKDGVNKLNSQSLLSVVALKADDAEIREVALKKMNSQHHLVYFVLHTGDPKMAKNALTRIFDVTCLATVATETTDALLGLSALAKINDEQFVEYVVVKAKTLTVRDAATRKLYDSKKKLDNK